MAPCPNEWTQMQQFLEDFQENFQDNMRRTMAEAIQAGVQAGVQAAFAANIANAAPAAPQQRKQRRNNPVFEERNDDSDVENPFGDNRNQQHNLNQVRRHRNDDDTRWISEIKVDIPEFHGGSQPEELLDWLVAVDEFIEFKEIPAHKQVPYATTRFRGYAASWWNQLKISRHRRGKDKIVSWDKLKKHMRKTFIPYNFERLLFQKFHNIQQGNR